MLRRPLCSNLAVHLSSFTAQSTPMYHETLLRRRRGFWILFLSFASNPSWPWNNVEDGGSPGHPATEAGIVVAGPTKRPRAAAAACTADAAHGPALERPRSLRVVVVLDRNTIARGSHGADPARAAELQQLHHRGAQRLACRGRIDRVVRPALDLGVHQVFEP